MTRLRTARRLVVLLSVAAFVHPPRQRQATASAIPPLILEHVGIIPGDGSPLTRDATLVIRDRRIVQVARSDGFNAPPDAQRVDATGKFAIPGLWDMHVHLFNNRGEDGSDNHDYFFPLLVANGIVGVRDMWTDPDDIVVARRWNEESESGRLIAPRVMWSSRVVDGDPPNGPHALVVHNDVEARQAVRSLKASGAGFIKVVWFLSRDAYFALADEAKKERIEFSGHVPMAISAGEASDAGQRTIEHNTGIREACSSKEAEWVKLGRATRTPAQWADLQRTYDHARCEALAHRFVKNGTWLVPTRVNFTDPADIDLDSRLPYVLPSELSRWTSAMKSRQASRAAPTPQAALANRNRRQMTQTMHRAGVRFMAGTDLSGRSSEGVARPFHLPGIGLHDELALMVEDGFSPHEALQAATSSVAEYAGQVRQFGTLAVGGRADVVLLDANPLEDIRNTRKIHAVILGGRLISRGELDDMVDRALRPNGPSVVKHH